MNSNVKLKVQELLTGFAAISAAIRFEAPWPDDPIELVTGLRQGLNEVLPALNRQGFDLPTVVEYDLDPVRFLADWAAYLPKIAPHVRHVVN